MPVSIVVLLSIFLTLFCLVQIWRFFAVRKMEQLQVQNIQLIVQSNEVIAAMMEQQQVLMEMLSGEEGEETPIGFPQ